MIIPEVQKPHWKAPSSRNAAWIGSSFPSFSRPSTVVTFMPSTCMASTEQPFTAIPFDHDRTGTARYRVATPLRSREAQMIPERLYEEGLGIDEEFIFLTVYIKAKQLFFHVQYPLLRLTGLFPGLLGHPPGQHRNQVAPVVFRGMDVGNRIRFRPRRLAGFRKDVLVQFVPDQ